MKFSIAFLYEKLYNKRPFCENRLSDCHTFVVIHCVGFSTFKSKNQLLRQSNRTNGSRKTELQDIYKFIYNKLTQSVVF